MMSLDYNLGAIENYREVCLDKEGKDGPPILTGGLKRTTYGIVFATMPLGMGVITRENYQEFYLRLRVFAGLSDKHMGEINPYDELTIDVIRAHIGLRTNVTFEPRVTWLKRIFASFEQSLATTERKKAEGKLESAG